MLRIYIYILPLSLLASCGNSADVKKRDIIDDDKFLNLLIDIHKAEGIITTSNLRLNSKRNDSVSVYNYVLKKHNVSRQEFNNTIKYYSFHTDDFLVFYDSISSYINSLNDEVQKKNEEELKRKREEELKRKKDTANLWKLKSEWILPDDGEKNPIAFKIKSRKQGQYTLKAKIKIFPDDKSINQRMTIIANYLDGTKDINYAGTMVKDGKFETYSVSISTNKNKKIKSISGWLLDHSKKTEKKHAHVKNVELRYFKESSDKK